MLKQDLLSILEEKPHTRAQLVEKTSRPRTTIYDNLRRLIKEGLVVKYSEITDTRGRPRVFFRLTTAAERRKFEDKLIELDISINKFYSRQQAIKIAKEVLNKVDIELEVED